MDKPISMTIEETREIIINVLNNSKLHPSVIELMLKGIYLEAAMLANVASKKEKQQYFDGQIGETNDELEEPTV